MAFRPQVTGGCPADSRLRACYTIGHGTRRRTCRSEWRQPVAQLEHIEAIEKRLWRAADTMRSNSNYASNEYFLPVMGLIFLRHAYSRFLRVKDEVEANLPSRGGKKRAMTKEDFSEKGAIFLQEKAQFDHLVSLPDSADRAKAISEAMDSIEGDYESLRGVLPKGDYNRSLG